MQHTFDSNVAVEVGVDAATFLNYLKQQINNVISENGDRWVELTFEELMQVFTWLTEGQIKSITKKLENADYIVVKRQGKHFPRRYTTLPKTYEITKDAPATAATTITTKVKAAKVDAETVTEIMDKWNSIGINQVTKVSSTTKRGKALGRLLKDNSKEEIITAIENVKKSAWLLGQNPTGWTISFDWFLKPDKFLAILEGRYIRDKAGIKNGYGKPNGNNGASSWEYNVSKEYSELTEADRQRAEQELI